MTKLTLKAIKGTFHQIPSFTCHDLSLDQPLSSFEAFGEVTSTGETAFKTVEERPKDFARSLGRSHLNK